MALAVRRRDAARALELLAARGLLDTTRRIGRRQTSVLLPLNSPVALDPALEALGVIRQVGMLARREGPPIKRIREAAGLGKRLSELIPRRWQEVGEVVVLRLPPELGARSADVGRAFAEVLGARAVVDIQRIAGELREPQGRLIFGDSAETVHREHGVRYFLDASKVMFSKGNKTERQRLPLLVKPGERVLDMFAGIGYFTIPIALRARPSVVVAVEKNPLSYSYLERNIAENRVGDVVRAVSGDCREVDLLAAAGTPGPFDRAILGYIPDAPEVRSGIAGAWEFLEVARRALASGGRAHFHALARRGTRRPASVEGFHVREMKRVKSYGPETYHVVLDFELK